jgi:arylsulfatase A-like enzyme
MAGPGSATVEPQHPNFAFSRARNYVTLVVVTIRNLPVLLGVAFPLGCLAASAPTNAAAPSSSRPLPNIVFILADDLGYGDLGCYGQTKIKTPNIDKLAAEGIRFTDCYAGSTVCAPSRCCLMTGLHTGHATVRGNGGHGDLDPNDFTVAQLLKQGGYRTALYGKWGLGEEGSGSLPTDKGFDEFGGYLNQTHAHDYYSDHIFHYDPRQGFKGRQELAENWGGKKGLYIPDLFLRAATNYIRINKPEKLNGFRPFFLYLALTVPHANNEAKNATGNGMQVPSDAPYSDETWPQPEKNKAAMITRMDHDIGLIMELLKKYKIDDNTIVLFSSDNGPHKEGGNDPKFFNSSGGLRGIKRDLYEGGIRVPMIVRWPGHIKPGGSSDLPCAFWDFLPTAAELTGLKAPQTLDGISLVPTLLGQAQTNQHAYLYWEFHERGFQQAIRMGEWKGVRLMADEPLELFNLKSDRAESTDVAKDHPDVVAKLESLLSTARTDSPYWPMRKEPAKKKQANSANL